jgi:Holliday junction resolvase
MTEKELTQSIRNLLRNLGVFHWKQIGSLGSPKGIADIIGIWEGKFLAIEVKTENGKLSTYQEDFLSAVKANNGIGIVARSVDDVIDGLGVRERFLF